MILEVDSRSPVPPYEQLRQHVTALVLGGGLAPGDRLPSIRQLANDLGLAGGTVARAYRELESDGVVTTHGRHGTVVEGLPRRPGAAARADRGRALIRRPRRADGRQPRGRPDRGPRRLRLRAGHAVTRPSRALVGELAAAGRHVLGNDLTWGTSGNISARIDAGHFAISASGSRLDELDAGTIAVCDGDGAAVSGRPSVEAGMHAAIYRARPDAGAVLHASPFHATLVASSEIALDIGLTTDSVYYLRGVARVPFELPGSAELAAAAGAAAADHQVLLLENHGVVVAAADVPALLNVTEILEVWCRMLVARQQGFPLRPLTPEQARRLLG